jgi:hypothetical protein
VSTSSLSWNFSDFERKTGVHCESAGWLLGYMMYMKLCNLNDFSSCFDFGLSGSSTR